MLRTRLLLAVLLLQGLSTISFAQQSKSVYSGQILGPANHPVAGATVQLQIAKRTLLLVTADNGDFRAATASAAPAILILKVPGYAPLRQTILPNRPQTIRLALATNTQRVVVTASRTALALNESANSVRVVSRHALQQSATFTIGDQLRQVTGLESYRRSSTLVANPTTEGISLRGLGSTAASRTLVLSGQVPLNDPFGDWVYWEQLPTLAVQDVEVVRGGASDLYGSSAIGGVVNVIQRQPGPTAFALDAGHGQENTSHASVFGTTAIGPWAGLFAGDWLRTDGYIQVAPDVRGPVDTAANVHYQNAETDLRRTIPQRGYVFLRGNMLNEARANGTPFQTNATRLWRYATGFNWTSETAGAFTARAFGSQEHYRQSFAAINATRTSEFLVRLQHVPVQQLGASLQWTKVLRPWLLLVAGSDVNDVRATDHEIPIHNNQPNGVSDTTARQRDVGEYLEGLVQWKNWTVSASVRGDDFLNLDAVQIVQTGHGPITTTAIPNRNEALANPRLGIVRRLNSHLSLSASAYRAFRSPTINELYRQFQVGQEITLANPHLQSERATGWETGFELALPQRNSDVRASYFWTEVNRPVTSLTLSQTPTQIVQQRENLGQIRSRGLSLDYQSQPLSWLSLTGGYQYANATVTQFAQDPTLIGKWIPEVAHNMATMQASATQSRIGMVRLLGTYSGRQYDNPANTLLLHGYFQLDGYIAHTFNSHLDVYAAVSNIFNRQIDVGRTPLLTLGTPRLASFGIRLH